MLSQASICLPERASVRTVRATGLPSESCPTTLVRQASFGAPCRASTTSWGLAVTFFSSSPVFAARSAAVARSAAFGAERAGVMSASEMARLVDRSAPR